MPRRSSYSLIESLCWLLLLMLAYVDFRLFVQWGKSTATPCLPSPPTTEAGPVTLGVSSSVVGSFNRQLCLPMSSLHSLSPVRTARKIKEQIQFKGDFDDEFQRKLRLMIFRLQHSHDYVDLALNFVSQIIIENKRSSINGQFMTGTRELILFVYPNISDEKLVQIFLHEAAHAAEYAQYALAHRYLSVHEQGNDYLPILYLALQNDYQHLLGLLETIDAAGMGDSAAQMRVKLIEQELRDGVKPRTWLETLESQTVKAMLANESIMGSQNIGLLDLGCTPKNSDQQLSVQYYVLGEFKHVDGADSIVPITYCANLIKRHELLKAIIIDLLRYMNSVVNSDNYQRELQDDFPLSASLVNEVFAESLQLIDMFHPNKLLPSMSQMYHQFSQSICLAQFKKLKRK